MAVALVFDMLFKNYFVFLVSVSVISTPKEIGIAINGNWEQPTRTKNDSITKVSAGSSSSSPSISPTTMNALNISTLKDFLQLIKLPWTSVGKR